MTEINEPIIPTHEFPEEDDMQAFREDPKKACEGMQKKYIGMTYSEFTEYRKTIKDYEGEVGEYQELQDKTYKNPYTHEEKTVKVLVQLPIPTPEEIIAKRIQELRLKLISGTITAEEREELKLLIG